MLYLIDYFSYLIKRKKYSYKEKRDIANKKRIYD